MAVSCGEQKWAVNRIEGKEIGISEKNGTDANIENFIKPYREKVEKDMGTVLAYAPETLDKNGQWQTTMGNMFADVALQYGNKVFEKREGKKIDIVMLNHGGIRTIIPKGDVTTRTAFEIMPFENSMVVSAMKKEQILEMITYIIAEKKPHPLAGLTFMIGKDNLPKNIMVQGKPLEDKIYYVGTNDYLYNGGDSMLFFKKGIELYRLDYKLRDILIDYFKDVDTIPLTTDVRISVEK
ncbi:5'-nucleotidase C-terminal domain-containing protein [Flavobacterium sp.]|uniref:5'-nucleotidase C-terminal domain-containing protein n=1 Tax=Flavobacterium sp. TaxID=239 RepID=UPI0039E56C40